MEKIFNVKATLTDNTNSTGDIYLAHIDTIANKATITRYSNDKSDYNLEISGTFLIELVDTLGDVNINNKTVNGSDAFEYFKQGKEEIVLEAIVKSLSTKNLLFTIPSLLNKLSNYYKTDLPIKELISLGISEIPDLNKWVIEVK